jgi:murein L,D-transpeptidase YcbB/YkuD
MVYHKNRFLYSILFFLVLLVSCNAKDKAGKLKEKELVDDPKSMNDYVKANIEKALSLAIANEGKITDSLNLSFYHVIEEYYYHHDYEPVWSDTGRWRTGTNHFISYLDSSALDGLFKEDYHYSAITGIKKLLDEDSIQRTDAVLWTKADLLLTDAFMHVICDLKQGRLQPDSASLKNDTSFYSSFFSATLNKFRKGDSLSVLLRSLQPSHYEYLELKKGIRKFLDSMDNRSYSWVKYPYRKGDEKDSIDFIRNLQLRLSESEWLKYNKNKLADSAELARAITQYQKKMKLVVDGKIGPQLVKSLNLTDKEKFNRIAITLDRYKQLPDSMPERYIWVNLPSFILKVWAGDTISFTSKVICGKPITPTPELTSAISDLVIYPTWTVPESIIKKEMLPGLKKNPGYLARKGLSLLNSKGEKVDPTTINWSKYSKGIPFKIQQGSGDDNALGVIKFNFANPYFVYLHDTNQRYLFKNSVRSLSHGCVRVQEWQQLASFIARNDSMNLAPRDTLRYTADSIINWIANKERHRIAVKNKLPLFIRYFTCEGADGLIRFYDDIYGADAKLKEKYFPGK